MNYRLSRWVILLVGCGITALGHSAVSPSEAEKLKAELTPFGAIRAGNEAGTIPAWDGGLTKDKIPDSYKKPGQHHPDPYAGEKPLNVITITNMDKYAEQLPEGLKAMLRKYPSFYVPLYPTHRSHSAPQWVYDNTYKNATSGKLVRNGNGIEGAFGGIPFPIPKNEAGEYDPLMIIWNHITRWRGVYMVNSASEAAVQRNGSYALVTNSREIDFLYYHQDSSFEELENILFYYLSSTTKPVRLAGGSVLVHETIDQVAEPRTSWSYDAGRRQIRRAPGLAYDSPIPASDGLRTADDTDMFNGAPDRFDWKLIGRKEMIIPYNNYLLDSPNLEYENILKQGHIHPEVTRYELHRVWVVEATLKEDERHIYKKRVFYIDEDSWSIAVVDQYDDDNVWRVSLAFLKNFYEVPTTFTALDAFHDLDSGRYHVQFLDNEEPETLDFSRSVPDSRYFQPSSLRRRGRR